VFNLAASVSKTYRIVPSALYVQKKDRLRQFAVSQSLCDILKGKVSRVPAEGRGKPDAEHVTLLMLSLAICPAAAGMEGGEVLVQQYITCTYT